MSVCVVAVWLRNRDILRDIYDYSTVITAAGKVEAGFKPYTGVRSPMQSSVYLLNYWAEQLFGRSYLGLTAGGLVQALGGALVIRWLLLRAVGAWAATLAALAVSLAGLLQHVVFFYNPIGIFCYGVVLLGVAIEPRLWPMWNWRVFAVCAALFLGGMNKLNFQGAALVLAGLLSLASWAGGGIDGRSWVRNILVLAIAGGVAPLGFELMWTGATWTQWYADVVLLPDSRIGIMAKVLDAGIYFSPVYDFHHHILVRAIGGVGLAVLLATGIWVMRDAWRSRARGAVWLANGLLVLTGVVMGALLMVTNFESVVLTSLAYPLLAGALYLNYRQKEGRTDRWIERVLVGACGMWAVVGGYAAWHGSRVLYSLKPPPRSGYVRIDSGLRALSYLNGVRMLPEQIDAMERVAARLASLEDKNGKLTGVLFGPALEWMERGYPDAAVRRSPVWYDAGTSLSEKDTAYFRDLMGGGTRRLVSHKFWQAWPASIQRILNEEYRVEAVGSRDVLYHPRGPILPPVAAAATHDLSVDFFRGETDSNILFSATSHSQGMALQLGPGGVIFGARENANWAWPLGASAVQGRAIARLDADAGLGGTVTFRIIAGHPDNGELLWETAIKLDPGQREANVPFSIQPGGRSLWLQTVLDNRLSPGSIAAGWRELRITHATMGDLSLPLPFGRDLQRISGPAGEETTETGVWYARAMVARRVGGWLETPAQNWRLFDKPVAGMRVEVEIEPNPTAVPEPVVVTLAWYRAGRFEIMSEKMIDVRTTRQVTMDAPVTEPIGWVGVLTRPAGRESVGHAMRIISWEAR